MSVPGGSQAQVLSLLSPRDLFLLEQWVQQQEEAGAPRWHTIHVPEQPGLGAADSSVLSFDGVLCDVWKWELVAVCFMCPILSSEMPWGQTQQDVLRLGSLLLL